MAQEGDVNVGVDAQKRLETVWLASTVIAGVFGNLNWSSEVERTPTS